MKLSQRFKAGWSAAMGQVKTAFPIFGSVSSFILGVNNDSQFLQAYKGWVYACVRAISEEVADIELKLVREVDGEVEVVNDHPALAALESANPQMTQYDLFEATQTYLELMGRSFWFIAKNNRGVILGLFPLRPDYVTVVPSTKIEDGFLAGFIYKPNGGKGIPLERDEVIMFKNFNPSYPYTKGYSSLQAAALAVDTDSSSAKWNQMFFKNQATPNGILSVGTELNEDQYNRLRNEWNRHHKGSGNEHKTAVLEGSIEYKSISPTHTDMDFLEQRRFSRDEILAMFRVPKTALGIVEDVNRANAEATDFIFGSRVITPKMTKITNTLNEFYLTLFPNTENMKFVFESPVKDNETERVNRINSQFATGYISHDEARAQVGLPPIENGASVYIPLNLVPLGEPVEVKSVEKPKKPQEKKKELVEKIDTELKKALEDETIVETGRKLIEDKSMEVYWKAFSTRQERNEDLLRRENKRHFNAQREQVLKNLKKQLSKKAEDNVNIDVVVQGVNTKASQSALAAAALPILLKTFTDESNAVSAFFGLQAIPFSQRIQEQIKLNSFKFALSVNETTEVSIRRTLNEGIGKGESSAELTNRVDRVFIQSDKFRAQKIARTETTRASQQATEEVYKSNGITAKQWFTALDERVCEWCGPLDGKIISIDSDFFDKGSKFTGRDGGVLNLSYSNTPGPPLHPQCRCVIAPAAIE